MPKPSSGPHDHPEYATDEKVNTVEQTATTALNLATQTGEALATKPTYDELNSILTAQEATLTKKMENLIAEHERNHHQPTEPPTQPTTREAWTLKIDPNQPTRPEWEPHYTRSINALNNPNHYQNHWGTQAKTDLYDIFRVWGHALHLATMALRATGKPEYLTTIQNMLDHLQDGLTDNGGWMGWRWLQSPTWSGYNTPWHDMDTMGSWGVVSLAAHTCKLNNDNARADYWFNNLAAQEQAWRDQRGGPPNHGLSHPNTHMAMYHHYTGNTNKTNEMLTTFRDGLRNQNGVTYWHHYFTGPTNNYPGPQPGRYYPSYTASAIMQLKLEKYDIGMTLSNLAKGWNNNTYPSESTSDASWAISNYVLATAWDTENQLKIAAEAINNALNDDTTTPRRAHIATGLLIDAAKKHP